MEPVTHALASLVLGRAGLARLTRYAVPMLLISGLAADLDWLSYAAGPSAFLRWHRGAPDSLLSALAIATIVALGFWLWDRRRSSAPEHRIAFIPALLVCACSSLAHVLIDLTNDTGVQALWPFSSRWLAWDIAGEVDPMLIAILLAGLLIPALLHLVGEEIGGRKHHRAGKGAIITICLAVAYLSGRAAAHGRVAAQLNSRIYGQESPLSIKAYPSASPFDWRGVVETPSAMHLLNVSLLPGAAFDPDKAQKLYKPDEVTVLERVSASDGGRPFLARASSPVAQVERTTNGYEVRIEDLRDAGPSRSFDSVVAIIGLSAQAQVTRSELRFATSSSQE